jgi:hypothetical protein
VVDEIVPHLVFVVVLSLPLSSYDLVQGPEKSGCALRNAKLSSAFRGVMAPQFNYFFGDRTAGSAFVSPTFFAG